MELRDDEQLRALTLSTLSEHHLSPLFLHLVLISLGLIFFVMSRDLLGLMVTTSKLKLVETPLDKILTVLRGRTKFWKHESCKNPEEHSVPIRAHFRETQR